MRRRHDEDGAVLVLTVVLAVALIGFGALAVDVGALYQEHRELQNGADAAALAIAQSCSESNVEVACSGGLLSADHLAEMYVDANAEDASSEAEVDLLEWANNRVTITATTVDDGQAAGELGLFFARVLNQNTGTPSAKASAKWGSPVMGSLATLPLVLSACEYEKYVGSGAGDGRPTWDTATNGPYDWLTFHGDASSCSAQAGQDTDGDGVLSGGFGWVDTNGSCEAILEEIADGDDPNDDPDYQASASTGTAPSQTDCPPSYIKDNLLGKKVLIPVFTDLYDVGTNGTYVISYYVAYYIHGYHFGGQYNAEWNPLTQQVEAAKFTCPGGGNERCIAGWFTTMSASAGEVGDGDDTGVRVYGLD